MQFRVVIVFCITFLSTLFLPLFQCNQVTTDDHIIEIHVGIYQQEPLFFTDESGHQGGIYWDILVEIAFMESITSDSIWSLRFIPGSYHETLSRLKNDEIHIMVPAPYMGADTDIIFSDTYLTASWGVVYRRSGENIETVLDMEGKKVGIRIDDIHGDGPNGIQMMVDNFNVNCTYVEYPDYQSVFQGLISGEIDSGVVDNTYAKYVGDDIDLEATSMIFNYVEYRFAYSSNGSHLKDKIDNYLWDMREDIDSIYHMSLDRYLGEKTLSEYEPFEVIPSWIITLMLIAAGALVILGSLIIIMDKQVKEKTRELRVSNTALEEELIKRVEAEDRVSFLLTLLRHDLKNKHQVLQGYLELLGESELSPENMRMVQKVLRSSYESKQLLDKVGLLGDIDREEDMIPVDLNEYLVSAINKNEGKLVEEGIDIIYEQTTCKVMGGALLEELFINLIENAIKHAECNVIHIDLKSLDEKVVVSVEDDGKGIPRRDWDKIFEKGYKGKDSKGMGIGTFLIYAIAESYDGTVEILDSELGGARFDITLKKPV